MRWEQIRLRSFAGGRITVQNREEEYVLRGNINEVRLEGEGIGQTLVVELSSMERNVLTGRWKGKLPPLSNKWVPDDARPYRASTAIFGLTDIGDGRVTLMSMVGGDFTTLTPKGYSRD